MHKNMPLNVFNSTVDRLDRKNDDLKEKKLKNQERIDRLKGKFPIPE